MTFDDWIRAGDGRCPGCGYHLKMQGCACAGIAAGRAGMAAVEAARPDDAARVDDAIRKLASTGVAFGPNEARRIHGVKGPVVGARFQAAVKSGLITRIGTEPSTSKATHGHAVGRYVGRRAA